MAEKLVLVSWEDAWSDDESDPTKWRSDCPVETVGWLLDDGKESGVVRVAAERGPVAGHRGITSVPTAMVKKVTRIGLS